MVVFMVALLTILLNMDITEGSPDPVPDPSPVADPAPLLDPKDPSESDDNNGLFFIYSHWPTMGPSEWSDEAGNDEDDDGDLYNRKNYGKSKWDDDKDVFAGTYDNDDDDDDDENRRKRKPSSNKSSKYGAEDSSEENPRKRVKSWTSQEDLKNKWKDDEAHLDTKHAPLVLSDDEDCWESGEGRPSKFGHLQGRLVDGEGCEMGCDSNLYDPVCGDNGKTYNNKCFLDEAICFYPDDDIIMLMPYACPDNIEERLCEFKRCGLYAECRQMLGSCQCLEGYVGNPRTGCTDGGKCISIACGENAKCEGSTGRCKCLHDYTGDPDDQCNHIDVCEHVKCVNNAYCYKGKCACRVGFEGSPETMCIKIHMTSTVEIILELSQGYDTTSHLELTKTLITKFCDDLLTTSWNESCDVQRGLNSPYAKYKNCQGLPHPVPGECQVIKFSKGKSETTTVRMIVKFDCKEIIEDKHDFIKNQIKNIPGLREPMTGEVIWYPRRAGPDSTFAMPLIFKMSSITVGCTDGEDEPTTKVEDEEECKDLLSPHRCEGIKAAFSCSSEPAQQYCSKHCGICTEGKEISKKECFDMFSRSECVMLKNANKCGLTEVELVCEQTCNDCKLQLHKVCSDIGTSSLCFRITHVWGCFSKHLPDRFKNMCRKSCELC